MTTFTYHLNRDKLKQVRKREGRYLLRTNLTGGDRSLRPIYHQTEPHIEAHVCIAFLAYCLHATLAQQLRPRAPSLTPRSVLDKFAAVPMLDVEIPTTGGRTITLTRYAEPEAELQLLTRLRLELPAQPPPEITAAQAETATLA